MLIYRENLRYGDNLFKFLDFCKECKQLIHKTKGRVVSTLMENNCLRVLTPPPFAKVLCVIFNTF